MNERIKELAEQAGLDLKEFWQGYAIAYAIKCDDEDLERFAELVRHDAREACAKLCDDLLDGKDRGRGYWSDGVRDAQDAIRGRTE
jgi:hypothetical protein